MHLADSGSMSVSEMPGTLVPMVPNSPRNSAGASGLGSHMSMWLGPPRIHKMMTLFPFFAIACGGAVFESATAS